MPAPYEVSFHGNAPFLSSQHLILLPSPSSGLNVALVPPTWQPTALIEEYKIKCNEEIKTNRQRKKLKNDLTEKAQGVAAAILELALCECVASLHTPTERLARL